MIPRPAYTDKLIELDDADAVKLLVGVRRCGKSSILALFAQHLLDQGLPQANILSLNFESMLFDRLRDPGALHDAVGSFVKEADAAHPAYLLIDEVQEIDGWARAVNSLKATFPVRIFATGSNSRLFSGEQMTYLSGRYLTIEVFPLSLSEFAAFDAGGGGLASYLRDGAFPAVALARSPEVKTALMEGLIDSVVLRDVVQRGRIENEAAFRKVAQFVLDGIGTELSALRVANTLKSAGTPVAVGTVDKYLGLMEDAHVVYRCPRYNIRGRERLRTNGKYYVVDTGLRDAFLGKRPGDVGHVLENLVFLELRRRGFEVAVGKLGKLEVDFVATKGTERVYVQVSRTLADESVERREFAPLRAIRDAYPKFVLSMDDVDYSQDGIRHLGIEDFLLGHPIG